MRMNQKVEDDEKGKLFVGGLSWETTHDNLKHYFLRFGDVIDCVVMKNNESGRSRGFGFVTFADPSIVDNVLRSGPHTLDGRTIDPKPCNPRSLQKPKKNGGYPKVFLGGLPSNITETDLRLFFVRYGKVMEVVIMYDQEKKKSRGFGFLSFEEETSVDRITNEHFINLNGKQVEIKKAEPRDGSHNAKMNSHNNSAQNHYGSNHKNNNAMGSNVDHTGQWLSGNNGGNNGSIHSGGNSNMNMGGHHQSGNGVGGMNGGLGSNNAQMNMMQGPNSQMGGPPMNMQQASMGAQNLMQNYQGWGTPTQQQQPQQQNYGYGTPNAPGSYQGWGAPPPPPPQGPQGPPPHQWNNFAAPHQGYQGYGPHGTAGNAANWNSWNLPQNSGSANTPDIYSRQHYGGGGGNGIGVPPPTGPNGQNNGILSQNGQANSIGKNSTDYTGYGNISGYGNYGSDQLNSYAARSTYGNDNFTQQSYQTQPPQGKGF